MIELQHDVGHFVVITTASIYAAVRKRSATDGVIRPIMLAENDATIAPGDDDLCSRKVALEHLLLDRVQNSLTILRPLAIHGIGTRQPREWWFLKRLLDGRRVIPLRYGGASLLQTSGCDNIAALSLAVLDKSGKRILNAADPDCLSAQAIAQTIATQQGVDIRVVGAADSQGTVGLSPFTAAPVDWQLDMTAAAALGYRPVATFAQAMDHFYPG